MFAKLLEKGKDFVKRFQENLDQNPPTTVNQVVERQIPRKKFLRIQPILQDVGDFNIDIQTSPYFKSFPLHSVSNILQQQVDKKIHQLQIQTDSHKNQEQNLNLIAKQFKKIIQNLQDQPQDKYIQPLECLAVISFHHKRGIQIEHFYPQNEKLKIYEDYLLSNAMPDSSHNKSQDYNYFNFKVNIDGKPTILYGVSFFKQIKVSHQMREKNNQLTRSHLQKAIAVITHYPLFGYLKMRLAAASRAFFLDINQFQVVRTAYQDINNQLKEKKVKIQISEFYIGTDLNNIFRIFGKKLMLLYKAILYKKRILVYAHSSSSISSFILSILSLFPGMLQFNFFNKSIRHYTWFLRQYGLPLRLFTTNDPLFLSVGINQVDAIRQLGKNGSFYVIGTTNRLIKDTYSSDVQVLVNLQQCSIVKVSNEQWQWQSNSKQQKQLIKCVLDSIQTQTNSQYQYKGNDDWIREQFHGYLRNSLQSIKYLIQKYRDYIRLCATYLEESKKKVKTKDGKNYQSLQLEQQEVRYKQGTMPQPPQILLKPPLYTMYKDSALQFYLQFSSQNLLYWHPQYPSKKYIVLLDGHTVYYCRTLKGSPIPPYIAYNMLSREVKTILSQQ